MLHHGSPPPLKKNELPTPNELHPRTLLILPVHPAPLLPAVGVLGVVHVVVVELTPGPEHGPETSTRGPGPLRCVYGVNNIVKGRGRAKAAGWIPAIGRAGAPPPPLRWGGGGALGYQKKKNVVRSFVEFRAKKSRRNKRMDVDALLAEGGVIAYTNNDGSERCS